MLRQQDAMAWIAIQLTLETAAASAIADALLEAGAISVDIADAHAGTDREQPIFTEVVDVDAPAWRSSRVAALFHEESDIAAALERARLAAHLHTVPPIHVSRVQDRDWVRQTQSQYAPIRISQRLWVVPSWRAVPDAGATTVILDPGVAFGTGSHATTRLCLEWLDEHIRPGCSLIDYGCGSGIIAIAAAKLGAGRVVGVDIDPLALTASRYNAEVNQVPISFVSAESALSESADVVIANILSSPLKVLAPLLAGLTRPGGSVVLSGILEAQADEVSHAYGEWFEVQSGCVREGWVRLEGVRRSG